MMCGRCAHAGTGLRDLRSSKYLPPPAAHQVPGHHGQRLVVRRFGRKAAQAGAILIAACREEQVSADAFIHGDYHGALTYCLCQVLDEAGYFLTYGELIRRLRGRLHADGFEQDPQLDGPREAAGLPVFAPARELASTEV
jgi:metacaspase-1